MLALKDEVKSPGVPTPVPAVADSPGVPSPTLSGLFASPILKMSPASEKTTQTAEKTIQNRKRQAPPEDTSPDVFQAAKRQCQEMSVFLQIQASDKAQPPRQGTFGIAVPTKAQGASSFGLGGFAASVRQFLGKSAEKSVLMALETEPLSSGHLAQHARVRAAREQLKKDLSGSSI